MTENVVAGVITSAVVWLAVWGFWSAIAWPRTRRLQRFFGLDSSVRAIGIYLSLLRVERAGGAEVVKVGFTGAGLIRSEYIAACSLRDSLLDLVVSHLPFARRLRWRLDITIDASPRTPLSEPLLHPGEALVLLGTKVHNALTERYFDANGNSQFIWTRNSAGQRAFVLRRRPDREFRGRRAPAEAEIGSPYATDQQAIIERIYDRHHRRWIIVVAGVGALATAGATKYLMTNWARFEREVSHSAVDPEFGVLLLFENSLHDLDLEHDISDIPEPLELAVADRNQIIEPLAAPMKVETKPETAPPLPR